MLWAGAGSAVAAQAQAQARIQACIAPPAAEALLLSVAPDLLRKVGQVCAPALPNRALLRRAPNPLIERYAVEADAAWPRAQGALGSLFGQEAGGMLESNLVRPLLTTTLTELIAKDLKLKDCVAIDRVLTLIEPLPPRNAAALVVTIMELAQKPGKRDNFRICAPAPAE
jgi:hypothetical protein